MRIIIRLIDIDRHVSINQMIVMPSILAIDSFFKNKLTVNS